MLSAKLESPEKARYPVMVSPKLDGIRCLIVGRVPVTRTLKPIPNREIFQTLRALDLPELDGELIIGDPKHPDCYRTTNSGVMSRDGAPDWTFWVFDIYGNGPFEDRLARAGAIIKALGNKRIRIVPHKMIRSAEELVQYEANHLLAGYEGVMGRGPGGTYKQGRATPSEGLLWKLKRFVDGEAKIVGFDEQMHNANEAKTNALGQTERSSHKRGMVPKGTLGALKVVDCVSGVDFDIGTGFSDVERAEIWINRDYWMGKTVKYKSMTVGVKDRPRHPVYLGERKDT
jgi:DNA ligase-1